MLSALFAKFHKRTLFFCHSFQTLPVRFGSIFFTPRSIFDSTIDLTLRLWQRTIWAISLRSIPNRFRFSFNTLVIKKVSLLPHHTTNYHHFVNVLNPVYHLQSTLLVLLGYFETYTLKVIKFFWFP
jgi:hypothetical protein